MNIRSHWAAVTFFKDKNTAVVSCFTLSRLDNIAITSPDDLQVGSHAMAFWTQTGENLEVIIQRSAGKIFRNLPLASQPFSPPSSSLKRNALQNIAR